jgi:hypothetical protein
MKLPPDRQLLRDRVFHERQRVRAHWHIARAGIVSATFWTLAMIAMSWAAHAGLSWVFYTCLVCWVVFSFPALYIQLGIILDVVGHLLLGQTYFYAALRRRAAREKSPTGDSTQRTGKAPKLFRTFFYLAWESSPLSSLTTWASTLLIVIADEQSPGQPAPGLLNPFASERELREEEYVMFKSAFSRMAQRS